MSDLLSALDYLVYEPRFLDPGLPTGFWLCDNAEDVAAVEINAGCLRSGGSWDDLGRCEAFLRQFPYVLVVCPDEGRRDVLVREARCRLQSVTFLVAETKAFRGCASVRQLRDTYGVKAVERILMDAWELPCYGLLDLADVRQPGVGELKRVRSGVPSLDKANGGCCLGEMAVWTGKRGEGKSTILSQMLLEAIDQGEAVCAYSGELQAWKFKYWTTLQAAGPKCITTVKDKITGLKVPGVTPAVQQRIDDWWRRRFHIYDIGTSTRHDAEHILRTFEYAHRCYGTTVFLVDNLMTAQFRGRRDADYYRAQSDFVGQLASFARGANVHVHLVAHPRKTDRALDSDDVGGSGDVTNFADNLFSMARRPLSEEDKRKSGRTADGATLTLLKNRFLGSGKRGYTLEYEPLSKRFYKAETGNPNKGYGWEFDGLGQMNIPEDEPMEEDPFPPKS